jgi:hypothetical protein
MLPAIRKKSETVIVPRNEIHKRNVNAAGITGEPVT